VSVQAVTCVNAEQASKRLMQEPTRPGFGEDKRGRFGWGAPEDEEVHSYINQLASSVGTYLYGRRMYETMVYWETAHTVPNQPQFVLEWARQWQAAEKIVYSRTLGEPRSVRTRIERQLVGFPSPHLRRTADSGVFRLLGG
jgi:hypothetical protein